MFDHYRPFYSKRIAPRNVDVYLPPGYEEECGRRYPVIYMHDGQNLFNPETAYIGIDWGVDKALERLASENRLMAALVIGIWNTPQRFAEYMPQIPVETMLNPAERDALIQGYGPPQADAYLQFIVEELKPFIDANYRTAVGRDRTFIMGSSMGGLISVYAVCEYPELFGGAGCLSTHWPAGDGIVIEYLKAALPAPAHHHFYFDYGTETLDATYEPYQKVMDALMSTSGYFANQDWLTLKFLGAEHSEQAWRERVDIPLRFLLS